jgi:Flp pilus assembly CpaE family ATPase
MIKKKLTVLLIEDNPDFAELVQRWLALRVDLGFNLSWADSLAAGLERLAQGGVDVILLDLGLPDSDGLPTFTRTRLHAAGVPIVLLSADDREPLALQMVQEGAQDYIAKSACNGDLLSRALLYAVARYGGRADKPAAESVLNLTRVIGVVGAKGGTGATTVACHLAVELQRQTDQKTLLMDLDVDGGMVRFLMNVESEYSILDAVQNAQHLDASFWGGIVTQGPGKLHVVPSPQLAGRAAPDSNSLASVLTPIRELYRWIVLDLGRLTVLSRGLLECVNELFLVSTTSVPALYEARRTIAVLQEAGFEGDRLRVLINQHAKNDLGGSDLDRLFGASVYAQVPYAGRELNDACVRRKLCAESSDFSIEIARLARKMAGLPLDKPKSRVSQMFSFSDKTRGADASGASSTR